MSLFASNGLLAQADPFASNSSLFGDASLLDEQPEASSSGSMFGQAGLLDDAPSQRDEDRNTLLEREEAQDDQEAGPSTLGKSGAL